MYYSLIAYTNIIICVDYCLVNANNAYIHEKPSIWCQTWVHTDPKSYVYSMIDINVLLHVIERDTRQSVMMPIPRGLPRFVLTVEALTSTDSH